MVEVKAYIEDQLLGMKRKELAAKLDLTVAMVGNYMNDKGYLPSLTVAKTVFDLDNVVLHPFAEESLRTEIERDLK